MSNSSDYPKHYCGVFGIFGHPNAAELTYYGLYALQHRGQESAGIATWDGDQMLSHKGMGLVGNIFTPDILKTLHGNSAIGHTRYSTTGSSNLKNAQPMVVDCSRGQVAIAHNGNLVNAAILRAELEAHGSIFQTTVDSEIILHLMAQYGRADHDADLIKVFNRIQGAYTLVILGEDELIGVRDPHGFRPLVLGRIPVAADVRRQSATLPPSHVGGYAYVLASETCALDLIQAEFVRDIEPGEIVVINRHGVRSVKPWADAPRHAFCIFEYVYFMRPDSRVYDRNIAEVRKNLGRQLAIEQPVDADIVIPVPDSGNWAAEGFSKQSGIPFEMAFVRNHYVGRTFLQPTQLIRDLSVRTKLNLIKEMVAGKRVVVVDDSIVRGTTARSRVNTLREAGAKEVHMRVSCPPHMWPCVYGIDFPTRKELMAANNTVAQIRDFLRADSLGYLSLDGMIGATGLPAQNFCTACYTGKYPVPYDADLNKFIMEHNRPRASLGDALAEEQQKKLL
jgi:amidophosphoribosyltransferase